MTTTPEARRLAAVGIFIVGACAAAVAVVTADWLLAVGMLLTVVAVVLVLRRP